MPEQIPDRHDPIVQFIMQHPSLNPEEAWRTLRGHCREGDVVTGLVRRIKPFGAFVELMPGLDGLLHRSQILPGKIVDISDHLWPGDQVKVVIQRIDYSKKRVHLSIADYLLRQCRNRTLSSLTSDASNAMPELPSTETSSGEPDQYETECQRMYEDFDVQPNRIRKILFVEDQSDLRTSLLTLLEEAGYEVTALEDAVNAPQVAQDGQYDLIFLDAHTPQANGIDVAASILKQHPLSRIVLMTGVPLTQDEIEHLASVPLVSVFQKPFRIRDLESLFNALETGAEVPWQHDHVPSGSGLTLESTPLYAGSTRDLCLTARQLVVDLAADTEATAAAVFSMNLVTRQTEMLTSIGIDRATFERMHNELDISPIKDVIIDDEHVFETDAIDRMPAKFRYLLLLLEFRACIGIPLTTAGSLRYGIFLFHRFAGHFTPQHQKRAYQTALALDAVIERHHLEHALRTTHEFSLVGQLSAGLAHEVNNRISALEAQVQLLKRYSYAIEQGFSDGKAAPSDTLTRLQKEVQAVNETVGRLRQTAFLFQQLISQQKGDVCHPSVAIQRATDLLSAKARKCKVRIEVEPLPQLPMVRVNDIALEQVLINLILNAIQQIHEQEREDGWVRVAACDSRTDATQPVQILITDNGSGIHRRWWERVFDLGFSTRPNGTGLGLFIARSLVESFSGRLYIAESAILTGTTFVVALPTVRDGRN